MASEKSTGVRKVLVLDLWFGKLKNPRNLWTFAPNLKKGVVFVYRVKIGCFYCKKQNLCLFQYVDELFGMIFLD